MGLNEFIDIVEKHTGMMTKVLQLPDQAGDVLCLGEHEEGQCLVRYEAPVSFDDDIHRTVEWYNGWSVSRGSGSNGAVVAPMISTKKADKGNAINQPLWDI